MEGTRVSARILDMIKSRARGDTAIERFLRELVLEESRGRQFWYKQLYKAKINQYAKEWRAPYED